MTASKPHDSDTGGWAPCRGGELQSLIGRLQSQQRTRTQRGVLAAVVSASLLVLAVGGFSLRRRDVPAPVIADISCDDCLRQAESYLAGALDRDLMTRIEHHLARCPHCREEVELLRKSSPVVLLRPETDRSRWLLTFAH